MAAECLLTERLGLFAIAFLTLSTFSGVRTVAILPQAFLSKAEAFSRMFCIHSFMVLQQEHGHDEECLSVCEIIVVL